MQDRLQRHPLFEAFEDPVSGVVSYLLKPVVAPVQQTFYYVNPSLAPDERWLWMHCAWPPAPAKTLALVSLDPEKPVVRHFPQGQFPTAQPLVMSDGGVLLGSGDALYKMDVEGNTAHLFSLPAGLCAGGTLKRLATHLSLSADGRSLLLDVAFLNHWFVGVLDLPSGEFRVIREFDSHHNHAQFSR